MEKSEQINELVTALAKAQSEIKDANKDKENTYFESTYATLSSVWNVCREPLTKNGLSVIQDLGTTEKGEVIVNTLLSHASGQWIKGKLVLTPKDKSPQSFGSASSYGRRYSLMSMVGVAAAEDDDGNAASLAKEGAKATAVTASKTPTQVNANRTPEQAKTNSTVNTQTTQAADELFEAFK